MENPARGASASLVSPAKTLWSCYSDMMRKTLSVAVVTACTAVGGCPFANADRAEPVPVYGYYNAYIDRTKQTFNGAPIPTDPSNMLGLFTTNCDVKGCVVKWLRETEIVQNPNAPDLYTYTWNNGRWESSSDYPYFCDPTGTHGTVPSRRSDFLVPNPDGSFWGERTFTVAGPGCPGEGPGVYWLPISLTPIDPPPR
jgi:hypothetical protein